MGKYISNLDLAPAFSWTSGELMGGGEGKIESDSKWILTNTIHQNNSISWYTFREE